MKVQRLRYYGGSSMQFLGDYTPEDYELKCECGNDTKFTRVYPASEMSIVQTYKCDVCGKEHKA